MNYDELFDSFVFMWVMMILRWVDVMKHYFCFNIGCFSTIYFQFTVYMNVLMMFKPYNIWNCLKKTITIFTMKYDPLRLDTLWTAEYICLACWCTWFIASWKIEFYYWVSGNEWSIMMFIISKRFYSTWLNKYFLYH